MSQKLTFSICHHNENVAEPRVPTKAYSTDVGYDLLLVRKVKDINSNTTMYDSSVSVIPPLGYYVEIVPRSSLAKLGYIMTNSVGIIDPNYRGTLKVVVTKINNEAEELELPFLKFQIIVRKLYEFDFEVIHYNTFVYNSYNTDRGSGGFGSTDQNNVTE